MKYKILYSNSSDRLADLVNDETSLGWTPLGGLAVGQAHNEGLSFLWFYQAMILEDKAGNLQ